MAAFCLMPDAREKFKNALRDGSIDPYKLNKMTSEERRAVFAKIVGNGGAHDMNASFEAKMLLKNQNYAYTAWAKKLAGITPTTRTDILAKIGRLDHVLTPTEEKGFLQDLASKKLGVGVSQDEAKQIVALSDKIKATEANGLSTAEQALKKGFTVSANDIEHGLARYDLQKYISDLKKGTTSFKPSDLKTPTGVVRGIAKLPRAIADVSKSIGASLDDSFALRQGSKAFITHPTYWAKEFKNSFLNIAKGFHNADEAQRYFKAKIMADPLYDQAVKDGLAIIKHEDVFPTSLPGRIPVAGKAFNASEVAYDAYAENLRMGLYKNELRLAAGKGKDVAESGFGKNVAKMVNSLTGRGGLGRLEPVSGPINIAFYSLRFLKSNVDTLLLHPIGAGVGGTTDFIKGVEGAKAVSFAQKRAAENLVKLIIGTAATLEVANKLRPGSVQFDPRSSDFGKIRVGDTRFEVTGGMDSIVTLAARLATKSTVSSTTGKVSPLNSGAYGAQTLADVVTTFFENKASPVGGVAVDALRGKTSQGGKPTIGGEIAKLGTPLNVNNFLELKNDKNSANVLAAMLADTLGISTNTYGNTPAGTHGASPKITKALQDAQFTLGAPQHTQRNITLTPAQYKQLQNESNSLFIQKVNRALSDPSYTSLTPDIKHKTLARALSDAKSQVLDTILPNTKVPKKGDAGYYQYQQQQRLKGQTTPKIKSY